jgi:hypothetical protein
MHILLFRIWKTQEFLQIAFGDCCINIKQREVDEQNCFFILLAKHLTDIWKIDSSSDYFALFNVDQI